MSTRLVFRSLLVLLTAAASQVPGRAASPWQVPDKIRPHAVFFDLAEVRLGPGPFRDAQARDAAYLLELSADRLLHGFRKNAGLAPKAPHYGGWEARGLAGHTLGHYLSACAMMYSSTGDERLRERVAYIVAELTACQTAERGGLISGFPGDARVFAEVAAGDLRVQRFDLNGGWVPWYNLHKTFAGLRDAVVFCGSEQALTVLRRFGDWAEQVTHHLSDEQFQKMLGAEHGGMNEAMADLYALTGDEKFLRLARRFCHREVLDPLARGVDQLDGLHANTQIPKLVGAARLYELTGDPADRAAATFFWDRVVHERSWVIGGNSESEHFFPPDTAPEHLTASTAETCNTYNMLRLTEHLYTWAPEARYFDFFERALYNHILASQDPATGMCTYFVSLRPGAFKYYHDPENAFWCCTGSGMENHAKYTRGIYAHAPGELFVNLFIPSVLQWRETGVTAVQETTFPDSAGTSLTFRTARPARFVLKLRRPAWLAGAAEIRVNGQVATPPVGADGYFSLEREWRDGDVVRFAIPMALHSEPLPPAKNLHAFLYGPIVLAGELGAEGLSPDAFIKPGENDHRTTVPPPVPVLIADDLATALDHIQPVPGAPLTFATHDLAQPADVTLIPFYRLHRERHVVYWSLFTPAEWRHEAASRAAARARELELSARTLDAVTCAEQQLEVSHNFRGDKTDAHFVLGRGWRLARPGGWFEYELATHGGTAAALLCTWWGEDTAHAAEVRVDGVVVARVQTSGEKQLEGVAAEYPIPPELLRGKTALTVRVQAGTASPTPRLLQLRLVRTEQKP